MAQMRLKEEELLLPDLCLSVQSLFISVIRGEVLLELGWFLFHVQVEIVFANWKEAESLVKMRRRIRLQNLQAQRNMVAAALVHQLS